MTRIAVVVGSTRQDRFADRPLGWLRERLAERADVELDVVDLRDHPLPFFDQAPPARTPRRYASPEVERFAQRIDAADGLILMTPEYNHAYSAVLKNAIDHTYVEWRRKPVAFVGWGGVGGARAVEQLRLVCVELETAPLRHAVHVPGAVMGAARQHPQTPDAELFAALDPALDTAVDDLLWWTAALGAARADDEAAA